MKTYECVQYSNYFNILPANFIICHCQVSFNTLFSFFYGLNSPALHAGNFY